MRGINKNSHSYGNSKIAKAALKEAVSNLLFLNVTHAKIKKIVHKVVIEASESLPRKPVVYNACFGEFEFSEAFKAYEYEDPSSCTDDGYSVDRTLLYDTICAFGKAVCGQARLIEQHTRCVYVYRLHTELRELQRLEDNTTFMRSTGQIIEQRIWSKKFGKNDDIDLWTLVHSDRVDEEFMSNMSKCALTKAANAVEAELSSLQNTITTEIADLMTEFGDETLTAAYRFLEAARPAPYHIAKVCQKLESGKGAAFEKARKECKDTIVFAMRFPEYWYLDPRHQRRDAFGDVHGNLVLDAYACAASIVKGWVLFPPPLYPDLSKIAATVHEAVGFLFAGSQDSLLKVEWVPQLADYHITNYDGFETVNWGYQNSNAEAGFYMTP